MEAPSLELAVLEALSDLVSAFFSDLPEPSGVPIISAIPVLACRL